MSGRSEPAAPGTLHVVATPIGHLDDLSPRAQRVLETVALIAAEDTRHTARLLSHCRIATPQTALHEHNEASVAPRLVKRLLRGDDIALVSDAGTPLISDPGYTLVREARAHGIRVSPVPGASALLAALSVCGLATDRFVFEGFLPPRPSGRRRRLDELADEPRSLVFYESPHRIVATLNQMVSVFGGERPAVLARELTKIHEEIIAAGLAELAPVLQARQGRIRGEFVVVVAGAALGGTQPDAGIDPQRLLARLVRELPVKQAAAIVADVSGLRKNALYRQGLSLAESER